jgi:hypothetical protein
MGKPPAKRVLYTLPPDQVELLEHLAKRLGSSQSGLLSILLEATLGPLAAAMAMQEDVSGPPRRWSGQYAAAIRESVLRLLRRGRDGQLDLGL